MADFKVGDEVTRFHGGVYDYRERRKVQRVTKRVVVLDDGSKWSLDGRPRPRRRGHTEPCIELTDDDDREWFERRPIERRLSDATRRRGWWAHLTTDQLRLIVELLEPPADGQDDG